jgi:hypothetical protein
MNRETMPTLDDLNDIKNNLLNLGDEPGILAAKGETPADIEPPETGLSDDLNALFDDFADMEEGTEAVPEFVEGDDFADIGEETEPVSEQFNEITVPLDEEDGFAEIETPDVPESEDGVFADFDLDLDDEPVFDMDGFDAPDDAPDDAPEPEDAQSIEDIPTADDSELEDESIEDQIGETQEDSSLELDPDDLGFDEEESDFAGLDSLEENLLDDSDLETGNELTEDLFEESEGETPSEVSDFVEDDEDLGFEDLVGLSEDGLDSVSDDLGFENSDEFELEDDTDLSFENSDTGAPEEFDLDESDVLELGDDEDLSFDDSDAEIPEEFDLDESDVLELGDDEDLSFDDSDVEIPEEFNLDDSDGLELSDEAELAFDDSDLDFGDSSEDFDLSGDDSDVEDLDSDSFGAPGDEIDLGDDEDFSMDDSEEDAVELDSFDMSDDNFDEDLEIDEFNLGDLGQDFGVLEEDLSTVLDESETTDDSSGSEEELEEEEFELSEDSFERVKATLSNLPRNLKLIIEEEIGEKGLKGAPLENLINALTEGKNPKEIAAITSKIVGKKIKIPANYAKRTGLDFEEEKGSFQYTLIHKVIPLIKIFVVSLIVLAAVGYVGFKFIYKPVYARILYNRGWDQLENGDYISSEDTFDLAFDEFKVKKQFYRYAEGYIEADQWVYAQRQYEKLLDNYSYDKKGTIDYASMEFNDLRDYEHSTKILNDFLSGTEKDIRDYDALLLLGDIYLEWGWEDSTRYDEARLAYAKIMSSYGLENKILFRMLKYFIRKNNPEEVAVLKKRFQQDKEIIVDPEAYAELAGYQIDRHDTDDVQEILFRAKDVEESIPEIHYQMARLFNITDEGEEEDKALLNTLYYLNDIKTPGRRKIEIKIDTYRRQGERFYIKEEYLHAEEVYHIGIDLLEESRARDIIKGRGLVYGQLYADLGNIYYYISENPENAMTQYEAAENEGLYSPEIYYNKGNIRYRSGDFRQSLLEFYNSAGSFSVNTNLLYATGNTLFQRNDYFAAQGYYNHLLDILEQKISSEFSIRINEREDHRQMVENLMKAYNNMGVTLYGLFERTGDPSKFTAAMLNFTQSNEYFDDLTRDPETLVRTDMINLAALNQRKMLYPIPDYELQIFADIPKSLAPR